ncbi:MAG: CvpA family protein [Candidatus Aureabacteria bacterium]|nr:CvpA family protein [Candidatus Auribacterota bacterium]
MFEFVLKSSFQKGAPCSFGAIFLAVITFFYMLNQTAHHLTQLPAVATFEHFGGAILGGAKALLFACLALILLALVKVESIATAVTQKSFFGPLAISSVPGAYKFVQRVYPRVDSLPAQEVIEKLPAVRRRTELEFAPAAPPTPSAPATGRTSAKNSLRGAS